MKTLTVLDPRAAFVDVGSGHMHVSVAGDEPAVFGTVTSQLHALRDWLRSQGVRSVAMVATGVYWLPLYGVLEAAGFNARMVNGRQTRNVLGDKTDMNDSQWGATLHMHGLLKAGFVPPADIRRLQDYLRLRADHVSGAGAHVQHMQKTLERMNIKLHDVIASLAGMSGLTIVRAIIAGERSPDAFCSHCATSRSAEPRPNRSRRRCAAPGRMSTFLRCAKPCKAGITASNRSPSATGRSKACCPRTIPISPHFHGPRHPSAAASSRPTFPGCARYWRICAAVET